MSQDNELIIIPGGPRPRSQVHRLASNATTVMAPGGRRLRSQVHPIGVDGGIVEIKGAAPLKREHQNLDPPGQSNWITAAWWLNQTGAPISSFLTTWTVPAVPATQSSQLLYLFNGLLPNDCSTILQPVLQWGNSDPSDNSTGPYWTVASWLVPVPPGDAYHTPHVRVNPGDTLVGVITLLSQSAEGFVYCCEFQGIADTKTPPMPAMPELVWGVETLEAYELVTTKTPPYDLNSQSEYPATNQTAFKLINILTGGAQPSGGSWTIKNYVSSFGEQTVVTVNSPTNGEVEIYYATPGGTV